MAYSVGFTVGVRQTLSATGALLEETTFEPLVTVVPAKRVQGRR